MKRLVVFLVLLGLGIAALRFAIGDDTVVTASGGRETVPPPQRPEPAPGVGVQQGRVGATIAQTGALRLPRYRTIVLPDGSERHEQVFLLTAADSRPVREGLQELEQLEVTLFEDAKAAGLLRAARAFVELANDANGRPSLREDKEIDLRQVTFESLPGSRLEGLRLALDNAKVQIGEDEILLHTPGRDDPVELTLSGARSGKLTGKGLQARLPRDRRGALQQADIEILSDPVVETDGLRLLAKGRLHYEEDLATGEARLSAEDRVVVAFTAAGGIELIGARGDALVQGASVDEPGRGKATVRGDRFTGWLMRSAGTEPDGTARERLDWQVLQVLGAPSEAFAAGVRIAAPRLTVLPGTFGQPFLLAAHGGPALLEQSIPDARTGADRIVGRSPRRIHVILPKEQVAAIHRGFGFPLWTLRPLATLSAVTLDGDARIEAGEQRLQASRGMHLFQPDPAQEAIAARGFGSVTMHRPPQKVGDELLHATGDDGFHLIATRSDERLRLGPAAAGPDHHYTLRVGDGELQGSGACDLSRTDGRTVLALRSPDGDVRGRLPRERSELRDVRRLDAELTESTLEALAVEGRPVGISFTRGATRLEATSDRVEQLGPSAWVLLPDPAGGTELPTLRTRTAASGRRGAADVVATAPRIELHHCGGSDWLVDLRAVGDTPARVDATVHRTPEGPPTSLELEAERLRLVPFAIAREALVLHGGGRSDLVGGLPFASVAQGWILGDEVHRIHAIDPEQGVLDGSGHRLVLTQGAHAATLFGDADALTPARLKRTQDDKVVVATGAQVRVFRDQQVRLQALRTFAGRSVTVPPSVVLHQPKARGALAHVAAVCEGNIDVLPDRIEFQGPVIARSALPDGSTDPAGMSIDASGLMMKRHPTSGDIVLVTGRDVRLDWEQLSARSAEIELDLKWAKCTARDPVEAEVLLGNGQRFLAPEMEIYYDRYEVRCFQGGYVRDDRSAGAVR